MLTACCPRCRSHLTSEVVSITAFRIWIRCDRCNCTWLERPAAYLLRRLIGRLVDPFTRHSRSVDVAMPPEEAGLAAAIACGRGPEGDPVTLVPAELPRGFAPPPPHTVEDVDQWFDRCEQEFGPKARVPGSVADWLESDPLEATVEQPAPPEQRWVPPLRPTMQGTFAERLDTLHDGLVKLEAFVRKCTREEEATARRLELPSEPPKPARPREGNVLQWASHKRGKSAAYRRAARRVAGE